MDKCPVRRFDHHSVEHAQESVPAYRRLRETEPVVWTDAHDGFWVVSRYADIAEAARDEETFSSLKDMSREGTAFSGVSIPPSPTRQLPIDLDPPLLGKHRKLLAARMSPHRARAKSDTYVAWADHCIDQFVTEGRGELVGQLASPVPTMATLAFLGLPVEDHGLYSGPFHDIAALPKGTAEFAQAVEDMTECMQRVAETVAERRKRPQDDAISVLVQGTIDGVALSETDVLDWVRLLLGGGIDTTTSLIAHSLVYLDRHPELRPDLVADRSALELFMEEMLRVSTPTQALARTATKDVELGGQQIKQGERVLLVWASANRDDSVFTDADVVCVDRSPNRHTSFGLGPHRCIGSHLARAEYLAVMERVLTRLPDFRLTEGARQYESIGTVNGWRELPATFTPGAVLGVPLRQSYDDQAGRSPA